MKQLPDPQIYEEEITKTAWKYMFGRVLGEVIKYGDKLSRPRVLDLMCGPGFLLNKIRRARPDYDLTGVDIDLRYIDYARRNYSGIEFTRADVMERHTWDVLNERCERTYRTYDVVTCTGALHHLPYDKQEGFLEIVSQVLSSKGVALIGDPYVTDYDTEHGRRLGAIDLGQAFTRSAIEGGASNAVVKASIDVMHNDIFGYEYKTSVRRMIPVMHNHFRLIGHEFTWCPEVSKGYGDYLFVLGKK